MSLPYDQIDQQVDLELQCNHPSPEIRRRRYQTFQRIFLQCPQCGVNVKTIPKSELDDGDIPNIPPYDEDAARTFKQRRQSRRKELIEHYKAEEKAAWWRTYNSYLQSDAWKAKRALVLKREQVYQSLSEPWCTECWSNRGAVAHHDSYRHVCSEPLSDLRWVCHSCHDRLHGVPEPTY